MNLAKLGKKLKKEFLADRRKATLLVLACGVFVWFWGPLVMKWAGNKPDKSAAPIASTPSTTAGETTSIAAANGTKVTWGWKKLVANRAAEPMTRSITFPTEQRNPFSLPERMQEVPVAVTEKATTSAIPAPAVPLTASELGIVVESIAYGRTKRMAMVNGKPVREDDLITIKTAADATTAQRARVISILPAEVLLELEGRTIPAQLRRKGLASEDSIGLITPTFGTN